MIFISLEKQSLVVQIALSAHNGRSIYSEFATRFNIIGIFQFTFWNSSHPMTNKFVFVCSCSSLIFRLQMLSHKMLLLLIPFHTRYIQRFPVLLAKCVCIFNSVGRSMNESNLDDLWHILRVRMTAILSEECNICTKLTDTNQWHK